MGKFDSYVLLGADDAAEYARTLPGVFASGAELRAREIGDGNLNYVFRVADEKTGKSVIIKQSGDTARISDQFKVSPERNRIEADILKIYNSLVPTLVPKFHSHDATLHATVMEDLSDHQILRKALAERKRFPRFADHISTFMATTLLSTSDAVVAPKDKKRLVRDFTNPDLCEITEDLVFTEPFDDIRNRNDVFLPNREFVEREIYGDGKLRLETAKLKSGFLSHAQSLIHGDLHSGSIFVTETSTKVIDPEFAFFGPAGYDPGNLVANLVFAWANARATVVDAKERESFGEYLLATIEEVVDGFSRKFLGLWPSVVTESSARVPGYAEWMLGGILSDTAGTAGLELSRRIVGFAHVSDITSIGDESRRRDTERLLLSLAKEYILDRDSIRTGRDFTDRLRAQEKKWPLN